MSGKRTKILRSQFPFISSSNFRFFKKNGMTRKQAEEQLQAEAEQKRIRLERNEQNNVRIAARSNSTWHRQRRFA